MKMIAVLKEKMENLLNKIEEKMKKKTLAEINTPLQKCQESQ